MMVSGNPNAKAAHLNQIKIDLNVQIREKAKLQEKLADKEKKEAAMLKDV